jgi:hypothetical protein
MMKIASSALTGREVLVNYKIPALPREAREDKAPVLGIVHDGGRYCTVGRTRTFKLAFGLAT